MIDFIRKNFPKFNRRLAPWESASKICLLLDRRNWREQLAAEWLASGHTNFLMQSHYANVVTDTAREALEWLKPERAIFLYPFRRFSRTIKSYAEFCRFTGPIGDFMGSKDPFFGLDATVADVARLHAEHWLDHDIHCIDTDRLVEDPDLAAQRLAAVLDETQAPLTKRLPRHKWFSGRLGELAERLTGRESSEMKNTYRLQWRNAEEPASIDREFAGLHAALSRRRIN